MFAEIEKICHIFRLPGTFDHYEEIKSGNVNTTYRVFFVNPDGTSKSYILQRVNTYAFRKPIELMDNADRVTEHIRAKNPGRRVLHYHHTADIGMEDRKTYYFGENDEFWRLLNYIDSVSYDASDDMDVIYNAGQAFGSFQNDLSDFDPETLYYTIPNFHNTIARYEVLEADLARNDAGRAGEVQAELDWLLSVKEDACVLSRMYNEGKLPLRVTHNDTKINNVLFDKSSNRAIAIIDLDTVMPGLMGHDFGDAIRFAANKVEEDCPDISKVGIKMDVFRAFAEGFLSETAKSMTAAEAETLALSPFVLACELATRFLDDYLNGDKYFHTSYPEHNLVRARCQIALAKQFRSHLDEMNAIVRECVEKYR